MTINASVLALVLMSGAAHAECGPEAGPCVILGGTYHIVLPERVAGPIPAILLLHGYGGEGLGTIRNKPIVNLMLGRGYAVIAPDGQPRTNGEGRTWDFHPDRPATRDETEFLIAVADDATSRFGLERDRMLLAGFSIGGSMTSYVACAKPEAFAASSSGEARTLGIYTIEDWTHCSPESSLSFALHQGGHVIPRGWAKMAVDWFETLP